MELQLKSKKKKEKREQSALKVWSLEIQRHLLLEDSWGVKILSRQGITDQMLYSIHPMLIKKTVSLSLYLYL